MDMARVMERMNCRGHTGVEVIEARLELEQLEQMKLELAMVPLE